MEVGLERTERALAKLDEGTYGLCDACGKSIAAKRLQAMPDVVVCIECAAAQPRAVAPPLREASVGVTLLVLAQNGSGRRSLGPPLVTAGLHSIMLTAPDVEA